MKTYEAKKVYQLSPTFHLPYTRKCTLYKRIFGKSASRAHRTSGKTN